MHCAFCVRVMLQSNLAPNMGLNKLISLSRSDVLVITDDKRNEGNGDNFLERKNQFNLIKCSKQKSHQLYGSDLDICKKATYTAKKPTLWSSLRIPKKIKGEIRFCGSIVIVATFLCFYDFILLFLL